MGTHQPRRLEVETGLDTWQRGTVQYRTPDGAIAVKLDGETRVDLWDPNRCREVES
jgi:hypothetical protein